VWPVFEIIDSVSAMATGRKSQLNIVERRNIEMIKNVEAKLSYSRVCKTDAGVRECISGIAKQGMHMLAVVPVTITTTITITITITIKITITITITNRPHQQLCSTNCAA
jgi:hypothetical protein